MARPVRPARLTEGDVAAMRLPAEHSTEDALGIVLYAHPDVRDELAAARRQVAVTARSGPAS